MSAGSSIRLGVLLLACSCGEPCVALPCAAPGPAVIITVRTAQGSAAIPGLVANLTSGPGGGLVCDSGSVCDVFGRPGDYVIRVSATGFASQDVKVTVTGEEAGCNSCGRVDTQHVSVVLAPATGV